MVINILKIYVSLKGGNPRILFLLYLASSLLLRNIPFLKSSKICCFISYLSDKSYICEWNFINLYITLHKHLQKHEDVPKSREGDSISLGDSADTYMYVSMNDKKSEWAHFLHKHLSLIRKLRVRYLSLGFVLISTCHAIGHLCFVILVSCIIWYPKSGI
jgi:hypothetical protein